MIFTFAKFYQANHMKIINVGCLFLLSILTACHQEESVMYSQEELEAKVDSLVQHFDTTSRLEFHQNYELRRHIEIRQRAEAIIESRKNKSKKEKNVFTDTVRLVDPDQH